jgi:type II secretory ATPase GspE/PulE/Tfp pilus assembly ATPase PilB-like protein
MDCVVGGKCSGTGFHGRVAVYELLEVSAELRKPVCAGASTMSLQRGA